MKNELLFSFRTVGIVLVRFALGHVNIYHTWHISHIRKRKPKGHRTKGDLRTIWDSFCVPTSGCVSTGLIEVFRVRRFYAVCRVLMTRAVRTGHWSSTLRSCTARYPIIPSDICHHRTIQKATIKFYLWIYSLLPSGVDGPNPYGNTTGLSVCLLIGAKTRPHMSGLTGLCARNLIIIVRDTLNSGCTIHALLTCLLVVQFNVSRCILHLLHDPLESSPVSLH